MSDLFSPLRLGSIQTRNRIFMAPLTRGRATKGAVPTPIMGEYYAQRAGAGLIISEATGISREGLGWPYAPGLWNDEQVEGWKPVVAQVHRAGGRIVAQLWHMGRLVHPDLGGGQPVAPSAIAAPHRALTYEGRKAYVDPRAMTLEDIARVVGDYAKAAKNAIAAGFDGVQIHGANGYLVDQFLRESANQRDDDYGGSIDNRLRFMREVVEAVIHAVGVERTSIRLSPNLESQGAEDRHPEPLFVAVAAELQRLGVPWIELRESGPQSTFQPTETPPISPAMRKVYSGKIILNSDYDGNSAEARMAEGIADGISFGRPYIANPDLAERIRIGAPLMEADKDTFYTQGTEGYTDYPGAFERP